MGRGASRRGSSRLSIAGAGAQVGDGEARARPITGGGMEKYVRKGGRMTIFLKKGWLWILSITLVAMLNAVAAHAEDDLSPTVAQGRVGLSDDAMRPADPTSPQNQSASGESTDVGELRLALREAVVLALKNNLDITIAGYGPKIKSEDISIAKAVFDPTFSLTLDANRTVSPTATALAAGQGVSVSTTENRDVNTSLV